MSLTRPIGSSVITQVLPKSPIVHCSWLYLKMCSFLACSLYTISSHNSLVSMLPMCFLKLTAPPFHTPGSGSGGVLFPK